MINLSRMAFRTKTKNKFLVEERQTLDAKHNYILQTFEENKHNLPKLENKLNDLNIKITELKDESAKNIVINMEIQKEIWKLDDEKNNIEKQIKDIQENIEENKYMLNTGKILSNYYKILDQEKQFATLSDKPSITPSCPPSDTITTHDKISIHTLHYQQTDSLQTSQAYDTLMKPYTVIEDQKTKAELDNNILIKQNNETIRSNNIKKKSIMDWFTQSDTNKIIFENIDTGKKKIIIKKKNLPNENNNDKDKNKSNDAEPKNIYNSNTKNLNKDTIYEKYMKIIDKNYININNDDVAIFDSCNKCKVEMLLNNNSGILICPNCGMMENIIVDSDKPSFKEPPKEMTSFCYKRINHLNEFLAQFQAKETTDIPEDVYNEILVEIKKERITNMALITPEKMRSLLKKIKKNDYYEHIPYIINQLNGLPAPVIAPEIEEIIRGMFKEIQIPFEKYCPHKRKNFLSYNYVMYKFFELLELDEYLRCFQLLKSRTKLHQQDLIWKNICKDLNWQFIKSL
jgi:uncharacterized Zn finger protein (UPF0148 family)